MGRVSELLLFLKSSSKLTLSINKTCFIRCKYHYLLAHGNFLLSDNSLVPTVVFLPIGWFFLFRIALHANSHLFALIYGALIYMRCGSTSSIVMVPNHYTFPADDFMFLIIPSQRLTPSIMIQFFTVAL